MILVFLLSVCKPYGITVDVKKIFSFFWCRIYVNCQCSTAGIHQRPTRWTTWNWKYLERCIFSPTPNEISSVIFFFPEPSVSVSSQALAGGKDALGWTFWLISTMSPSENYHWLISNWNRLNTAHLHRQERCNWVKAAILIQWNGLRNGPEMYFYLELSLLKSFVFVQSYI